MKLYNYIVIMVGLVIFLNVMGIDIGTNGIETLINMATGELKITSSNFFKALFSADIGALVIGLGASILAGFVLRGKLENFIILPFITGTLVFFAQVFQGIINYSLTSGETWASWIIILIFGPLLIGFIIALIEFFRGTD